MSSSVNLNLLAGWISFLLGAASGALIGLKFHREEWMGGYQSFRRRLMRLGHIALFGLGLINILFALSAVGAPSAKWTWLASALLAGGAATMPLNCFLTAWRPVFRHAFFVPASLTMGGIGAFLLNWVV